MSHNVKTLVANVTLPGAGQIETAQTVVTLADTDFQKIPAAAFTGGKLQDLGSPLGVVSVVAPFVAAPAAVTSSQEATANASDLATAQALANSLKTKYNAAQADIVALQAKVAAILTALKTAGGPMAPS
jgi:hypothetical protein